MLIVCIYGVAKYLPKDIYDRNQTLMKKWKEIMFFKMKEMYSGRQSLVLERSQKWHKKISYVIFWRWVCGG